MFPVLILGLMQMMIKDSQLTSSFKYRCKVSLNQGKPCLTKGAFVSYSLAATWAETWSLFTQQHTLSSGGGSRGLSGTALSSFRESTGFMLTAAAFHIY